MAPEQLRDNVTAVRSDIYSAGVVLYELATGKRPFGDASGPQLISAILDARPSPPRSRNQGVPPPLEAIILKALDKNPERRYQSARELRVDLERLGDGLAPMAQKPAWPVPAAIAGALVAAVALVALNLGGARDRLLRRPEPAAAVPAAPRRSVAVLGFGNLSGRADEAWMSTALAEMLTTEMDLAGARQRYDESLAITRETGYKRGQAYSKFGLAEVLAAQGRLDEARAAAEATLAMRTGLADENNAAWSRLQLASIAIEQRRPADAERLARDAAAAFERLKAAESGAVAQAWLSNALVEPGRNAGAAAAADRSVSLARGSASRGPRFEAAMANARVLGATGRAADAVRLLEATIAEANKYGYLPYELQARLAARRIEKRAGMAGAAARLAALERDANARGFKSVGTQAAAARSLR